MLAIVSLERDRPVRMDSMVTGAINDQGDIIHVGEIRTKVAGAILHRLSRIVLPVMNGREVANIDGINIVPVLDCQDVVDEMIC
ncbi:hypothetical protein niasHT_026486 [Heterodera trifolii]|uniref:Lon proteolytic domain-containing protein n=1 Tax=Heterodera trifolii TaxID=157864 RepID=A0ABD2JS73_9BILA